MDFSAKEVSQNFFWYQDFISKIFFPKKLLVIYVVQEGTVMIEEIVSVVDVNVHKLAGVA